jgi:integrase
MMGKTALALSFKAVEKLTKLEGLHAVGGCRGLYLQCKNGGVSWILRVMIDGKRRDIGLGGYHDVTLEEARDKCLDMRRDVRKGVDPLEEKRRAKQERQLSHAKSMTFATCVEAYLDAHEDSWKNTKHRQQWRNTLTTYALPVFGGLQVSDVDTGLVMKALEPIWKTKTETASRLRGRIEQILDWATVRGYRHGENPARWKGHLDKLLPAKSKVQETEHHPALSYKEISAFMPALRQSEGMGARALEFAILTVARSGEVRGATWGEIELDAGVWTIPPERMKAGKEHRIPLSPQAVVLLRALPVIVGNDYVFPAPRGGMLSDMTLTAVMRRMGRAETVHGFRSTFRDWAGETTAYPREVIEHALAHQLKDKAEAAYARGTLFDKRRRLMADWAKYLKTVKASANVVQMQRRASKG